MAAAVYLTGPIIWRPLLATLALHAALVYALTTNWVSQEQAHIVPKKTPRYIEARLVTKDQLKPKKKPRPRPVARKPAPKPAAKPQPAAPKPAAAKPKSAAPQPAAPKLAETTPKPEPVVEDKRPTAEELARQAQQELAYAMESEDEMLEQASDFEIAQSYVALIARSVEDNWSRPPSARNGMEAELTVQLIPTGEVVNVSLRRSSGDPAFDRSAINAVQKAERFPELQNVPSRVFEQNFRRLRLLFKPEDLRF